MKRRAPLATSPTWAPASAGVVQLEQALADLAEDLAPSSAVQCSATPSPVIPAEAGTHTG